MTVNSDSQPLPAKTPMQFRLSFRWARQIRFTEQTLNFACGGPHDVEVVFRRTTPEESNSVLPQQFEIICSANGKFVPTRKVIPIFESLAQGYMPASCHPIEGRGVASDGKITAAFAPLEPLPPAFQDFISKVRYNLEQHAVRAMKDARWYLNLHGPDVPSGYDGMLAWSLDGISWNYEPRPSIPLVINAYYPPFVTEEMRADMESLVGQEHRDPLGHELYVEAEALQRSNPRSALMLAIAAVEVGFKECIADLVPDATWLAMEAPTPPLDRMLRDYLPKMPVRRLFDGRVLIPSPSTIDMLRNGVSLRNALAHKGATKLSPDSLGEILSVVRLILYLLDYYRGFEWARKYIHMDFLTADNTGKG